MTDDLVKIIASAIAGTLISSVVAKAYIMKSLKDLETALTMCNRINERLAEINVKMHVLDHMQDLLQEHDRKIAAMGGGRYGDRSRYSPDS